MIVYDLRTQPMAVGEFLSVMEMGAILGDDDIAFSYDPRDPTRGDPKLDHVTKDNFQRYFKPFLSLTHGKVVIDAGDYDWPTPEIRDKPLFHHLYNEVFTKQTKPLSFRSRAWADAFLLEHEAPYIIHLRLNPFFNNARRNSDYQTWLSFLKKRKERFVLIGEVMPEFRLDNTVIAKDYKTTTEQEMALVEAADVFLGPPSGPSSVAVFNRKPYRIFNATLRNDEVKSYRINNGIGRFQWATWNQKCMLGKASVDQIEREFNKCLN